MTLAFTRQGDGPPLVLLPGTACDGSVWRPVLPRLARAREVITVDLPGFGGSAPLPEDVRPDPRALAAAVAALLYELDLGNGPVHVAGNSLGGGVALELGWTGRAASVCAISPIGFWTAREFAYARASMRLAVGLPAVAKRAIASSAIGRAVLLGQYAGAPWRVSREDAVALASTPAPGFAAVVDAYADYRIGAGTAAPPCPTTLAWGRRDWLLVPRQGRRAQRVLPDARFVWLDGAGHLPTLDHGDRVAEVILEASGG
jgi:pimeloyl-ACP methyl ester carboxylesterase